MPKKDSQTEINKRYWECRVNDDIIKDYQKYCEEQIKLGAKDSNELPFYHTFAWNRTQNGPYKGFDENGLKSLLKNLLHK